MCHIFVQDPLSNIKKIDCALLPPCRRSLEKKLQRAHYVAVLQCNANTTSPDQGQSPADYGWSVKDDLLQPLWFDGPATPSAQFSNGTEEEHHDSGSESDDTVIQSPYDLEESDRETDDQNELMSDFELSDDEPWSEDSDSEIPE